MSLGTCAPATRSKLKSAAEHIHADPTVAAVDLLAPAEEPTGRWTIEVTTTGPLRPALLRTIAVHGLAVGSAAPKAAHSARRALLRPADADE